MSLTGLHTSEFGQGSYELDRNATSFKFLWGLSQS